MSTKAYNGVQGRWPAKRRPDMCCSCSETYKSVVRIRLMKTEKT
jgi:hypothetical protein